MHAKCTFRSHVQATFIHFCMIGCGLCLHAPTIPAATQSTEVVAGIVVGIVTTDDQVDPTPPIPAGPPPVPPAPAAAVVENDESPTLAWFMRYCAENWLKLRLANLLAEAHQLREALELICWMFLIFDTKALMAEAFEAPPVKLKPCFWAQSLN